MSKAKTGRNSAFADEGFSATIERLVVEVQSLYLADRIPWVVGYSGGKDSTATLQLVWMALEALPVEQRTKQVHVISTDTLVENPVVSSWVAHSLELINRNAVAKGLPIEAHKLTPQISDTFWVNLIGRGYPAPRPKFRWCTERLKIKPSNEFIRRMVRTHGEAILVLGTRKAESSGRAARMNSLESHRVRDQLSPNSNLPNSLVYSPVENWSNDDVWLFLMQRPNPWGYNNKDLLTMYQGASSDGECPLVVDTSTPSCGDSRFGCWTCTLVDKDKSMSAMIQNDDEKEWMRPLLDIRNDLDKTDDRDRRDFRRMNGTVQLFHDEPIHGPYLQQWREAWLRKLLEAQSYIRQEGPDNVSDIELITQAELEEIRRIWVVEKHEFEDTLPGIYEEAVGSPYPGKPMDDHLPLGAEDVRLLREIVGEDSGSLHFEMVRELLDIEQRHRAMSRRAGLFDALQGALRKGFYDDREDALERALTHSRVKKKAQDKDNAELENLIDFETGLIRLTPIESTRET
ncbi:DNA phosphorothioation system sulfurtransferase DndC [Actinokineospora spheciospongiae]|uniref:DNA phosphorothioation system sulfurtransferase DndC n=1 Tax=Actinokineospora spheciospongiae TaxID=909613 RepID=UPI000D71552B|nr:DNA phosphorothioation system sulfurtransferase DndC [Actinokineospora spheciospongiae]PWW65622.1 DNA sulfur modification protein DndC [Actinokineospora spheciospongiae]